MENFRLSYQIKELANSTVYWDDYLYSQNGKWKGQHYQWGVEDSFQIKHNAYRDILTRGRDGTIIYVPPNPILDQTWHLLRNHLIFLSCKIYP